ncbi:Uncharacterised protein [Serratia marcescens]|nr:Uncharacterised protein [Serratia marcescens]
MCLGAVWGTGEGTRYISALASNLIVKLLESADNCGKIFSRYKELITKLIGSWIVFEGHVYTIALFVVADGDFRFMRYGNDYVRQVNSMYCSWLR